MDRMSALPEDVVAEILVRVPAGDLIRSKTVSKLWNKLISDSRFVESHLRHWSTGRHGGGILFVQSVSDIMEPSYLSLDDDDDWSVDRLCHDFIRGRQLLSLPGHIGAVHSTLLNYGALDSCDGLLLTKVIIDFGIEYVLLFLVCNPVTGPARLLPPILPKDLLTWHYDLVRIIYDPSAKRHKVVCLAALNERFYDCCIIELDRGEQQLTPWKELKVPWGGNLVWILTSLPFEGKLHLLTVLSHGKQPQPQPQPPRVITRLVSLNLASEEFEAVDCSPGGPITPEMIFYSPTIHFSSSYPPNGMIYHMDFLSQNEFDLWSLGVLNSPPTWCRRRVMIGGWPHPPPPLDDSKFVLVCVLEDDSKFVFFSLPKNAFFVYETVSGKLISIPAIVQADSNSRWFSSVIHVNSLLSFN